MPNELISWCRREDYPTSRADALATRADPQAEPAPQLDATQEDCNSIVDIARDLQRRRAAGLTEDQALAQMSARGRYLLGYVVDGVFRADPDTSVDSQQYHRNGGQKTPLENPAGLTLHRYFLTFGQ